MKNHEQCFDNFEDLNIIYADHEHKQWKLNNYSLWHVIWHISQRYVNEKFYVMASLAYMCVISYLCVSIAFWNLLTWAKQKSRVRLQWIPYSLSKTLITLQLIMYMSYDHLKTLFIQLWANIIYHVNLHQFYDYGHCG